MLTPVSPQQKNRKIRGYCPKSVRTWLSIPDSYSDTETAVGFSKQQQPKSILKTRSAPFPTAPMSSDVAASPSPESPALSEEEEEQFDKIEADRMSMLAAAALKLEKRTRKERLDQDLAAAQRELALTKYDLELVRFAKKSLTQSRDKAVCALADADKRADAAETEAREASMDNSRLENKIRSLEDRFKGAEERAKSADEQVEKLQRELTIVKEEKAEMEKLGKKAIGNGGGSW